MRLEFVDVVQALTDSLDDLVGLVAALEARRKLGTQGLLNDGRGERETNDAAERAEQVRAGGRDGLVGRIGVCDEGDERCSDADAAADRAEAETGDDSNVRLDDDAGAEDNRDVAEQQTGIGEDGQAVVLARLLHDEAGENRAEDGADDGGNEPQAGLRSTETADGLKEEWNIEDAGDVAAKGEEIA